MVVTAVTPVAASQAAGTASASSVTVGIPTGVTTGDLMVAVIAGNTGSGITFTPPSGWTAGDKTANASAGNGCALFWKVATAGDTAGTTYTFTTSGTLTVLGGIIAYRPATGGPTVAGGFLAGNVGTTANPAMQSLSTPLDNTLVVAGFISGGAASSWTPPGSTTERVDVAHATVALSMELVDFVQATAGATPTTTATHSVSAATTKFAFEIPGLVTIPNRALRTVENIGWPGPPTAGGLIDDFNRADENPNIGPAARPIWQSASSSGSANTGQVIGNVWTNKAASTVSQTVYALESFTDSYVQGVVHYTAGGGSTPAYHLLLRAGGIGSGTWYRLYVTQGSTTAFIGKDGAAATSFTSAYPGSGPADGDVLRATAVTNSDGSVTLTLLVQVGGSGAFVQIATLTDSSSPHLEGYIGMNMTSADTGNGGWNSISGGPLYTTPVRALRTVENIGWPAPLPTRAFRTVERVKRNVVDVTYDSKVGSGTLASATTATRTITVPGNIAAGKGVVLAAFKNSQSGQLSSVSDSRGNTWVVDQNVGVNSGFISHASTAMNVAPLQTGDTITLTYASSVTHVFNWVLMATSVPVIRDVAGFTSGSLTSPSVTASADDLLRTIAGYPSGKGEVAILSAAAVSGSTTWTAGGSATLVDNTANGTSLYSGAEYHNLAAAGDAIETESITGTNQRSVLAALIVYAAAAAPSVLNDTLLLSETNVVTMAELILSRIPRTPAVNHQNPALV